LRRLPFKEGAWLKRGDVLFEIDPRPFQADLDSKLGTVTKGPGAAGAARRMRRAPSSCWSRRRFSKQEVEHQTMHAWDQAAAQLAADKAWRRRARSSRSMDEGDRRPISGRVSRINVTVGNQVNGGAGTGQATLLTTIVSVDPITAMLPIPERAFLRYQDYASKSRHAPRRERR